MPENLEFIEVKRDDEIASVADLAAEIWTQHYTPIIGNAQVSYMISKYQSFEAIEHQISSEGYSYYLMRDASGSFVGYFAVVRKLSSGELFLSKLYVLPRCRGKGYARRSVDFIERIALRAGMSKIYLTVAKRNEASIAAYLKMGFENKGSVVADIGGGFVMDDYRMEKIVAIAGNGAL